VSRKGQIDIVARRRARECALKLLFQLDGRPPEGGDAGLNTVLETYWKHVEPEALEVPGVPPMTEELVRGVMAHLSSIDEAIQATTQRWRLERMARVDRNAIRLAAFEMLYLEVPSRIVINEAVELAKQFGTEDSGSFVNGVLDRVAELAPR